MATGSERQPEGPSGLPLAAADLATVDSFRGDTLALFCWSDVRPLRGVAGLVDWRLCGALSHTLEDGLFGAVAGEVMLMPLGGRLAQRRMFVFGLGAASAATADSLRQACRQAFDVLEQAKVERVTFVAPRNARCVADGDETAFVRALTAEREGRRLLVESVLVEKDQ